MSLPSFLLSHSFFFFFFFSLCLISFALSAAHVPSLLLCSFTPSTYLLPRAHLILLHFSLPPPWFFSVPPHHLLSDSNIFFPLFYPLCVFPWPLRALADSEYFDRQEHKGTGCMSRGTSVQKVFGHFTTFCEMERHSRGHFTMFCALEGHPRGDTTTFWLMERRPRRHFTFCPLAGHPRGLSIMFCALEGHPRQSQIFPLLFMWTLYAVVCLNLRWILHNQSQRCQRSCLCICTVLKSTSSNRARADKACRAWVQNGALTPVKQTGLTGQTCSGTVRIA